MSKRDKTVALSMRLKRDCIGYDSQEVGIALTSILIDLAQTLGMPKEHFMVMLSEIWELQLEAEVEDEVRH